MKSLLVITAALLFVIWFVGLFFFKIVDAGDVIHSFLIGAVVLILIRLIFYRKLV